MRLVQQQVEITSSVEFIAMLCELQIANWTDGNICQVYHHLRSHQIIQRGAHMWFFIIFAKLEWVVWVAQSQLTSKMTCCWRTLLPNLLLPSGCACTCYDGLDLLLPSSCAGSSYMIAWLGSIYSIPSKIQNQLCLCLPSFDLNGKQFCLWSRIVFFQTMSKSICSEGWLHPRHLGQGRPVALSLAPIQVPPTVSVKHLR